MQWTLTDKIIIAIGSWLFVFGVIVGLSDWHIPKTPHDARYLASAPGLIDQARLYHRYCEPCHDTLERAGLSHVDPTTLRRAVRTGTPSGDPHGFSLMPAFVRDRILDRHQAELIVDYVRSGG